MNCGKIRWMASLSLAGVFLPQAPEAQAQFGFLKKPLDAVKKGCDDIGRGCQKFNPVNRAIETVKTVGVPVCGKRGAHA